MKDFISGFYSKNLVTIKASQLLGDAEEKMNNYNIRHLPVVDENEVIIGVVSKSDFIGLKYIDSRLNKFTVGQFMSSPVVSVSQFSQVKEVAELFINKKISSALVVSGSHALGIITTENLLKYLLFKIDNEKDSEQLDLMTLVDSEASMAYSN